MKRHKRLKWQKWQKWQKWNMEQRGWESRSNNGEGAENLVIAVPSQGKELDSHVSSTFGRSQFFILFNTDTADWVVLDHSEISKSDNAGIKTAQQLVDQHADVLLSCRVGGNAARVLRAEGIRIYRAVQASVGQLLDQYLAGELLPLQDSASFCSRTIAC